MRLISGSLGLFNGTIFLFAESCAVHRGFFYNAVRFARLLKCSTTEWSSFSWNSGGGYAFGRSTVLSVLCGSNFDTSQDSQIYLYMEWVLGVLGSSYLAAGAQWNLVTSVDEPLELIRRSVRDVPWNPWDCLGCIFDFGILNQFRFKMLECWNWNVGILILDQFWFCKFIQRTPEDGAIFTEIFFFSMKSLSVCCMKIQAVFRYIIHIVAFNS